jgi:hypothetical protein
MVEAALYSSMPFCGGSYFTATGSSLLQAHARGKYPPGNPNHIVATRFSGARKIAARSECLCLVAILASITSLAGDGARNPRSHRLMVM